MRKVWHVTAMAVLSLLIYVPSALAADADRYGENIGDTLKKFSTEIFWGVVAILALIILPGRSIKIIGAFVIAVVVLGGFVMAQGEVKGVVKDIWHSVTA